jgi:biofilm protein TabA
MALIGSLEILKKQTQDVKITEALKYLQNTNITKEFGNVSPGNNKTIEIDLKNIYAIYQEYMSKPHTEIKVEGHKKYIDIQYIFEGEEQILLSSDNYIVERGEYNEEKDCYFPKVDKYSVLHLKPGDATILFPEDLHGPGYCIDKPDNVKKVVIKVTVD